MSQFHYSGCLTTAPTFSAICDYLHRQNKVQHSFLSCALIFFFLIFLGLWIKSLSLTLIVLLTASLNFVRSRPSTVLISLLFTYCIWPSQGSLLFPKAKPRLSFFFRCSHSDNGYPVWSVYTVSRVTWNLQVQFDSINLKFFYTCSRNL